MFTFLVAFFIVLAFSGAFNTRTIIVEAPKPRDYDSDFLAWRMRHGKEKEAPPAEPRLTENDTAKLLAAKLEHKRRYDWWR